MTERFPFGPSTRPLFPREQRCPSDRPGAVQGAKRRSEPLTARTDLESCEARGKGRLAHWHPKTNTHHQNHADSSAEGLSF